MHLRPFDKAPEFAGAAALVLSVARLGDVALFYPDEAGEQYRRIVLSVGKPKLNFFKKCALNSGVKGTGSGLQISRQRVSASDDEALSIPAESGVKRPGRGFILIDDTQWRPLEEYSPVIQRKLNLPRCKAEWL